MLLIDIKNRRSKYDTGLGDGVADTPTYVINNLVSFGILITSYITPLIHQIKRRNLLFLHWFPLQTTV